MMSVFKVLAVILKLFSGRRIKPLLVSRALISIIEIFLTEILSGAAWRSQARPDPPAVLPGPPGRDGK